jgi:uncharacterized protein YprB with RNaseH-like and TPR domain
MRDDLRQRLRELGVVRGVRELATPHPSRRLAIEDLVPGCFHTTSHGQCFVAEEPYPSDHVHGDLPLSSFLNLSPHVAAQVAQDRALASVDLRQVCFLDTETTGLSGGAGTMAFVVGLGFFAEDGFRVRQYFLRDPGDEPAMIEAVAELLPEFEALVSFNGRAFDVPILENRFILARIPPPMAGVPHLDLLHPARRLYHYRLASCALGSLERGVLGVLRAQDDVPGGVIPYLYRDYLRTGDARDMKRVLYHNTVDILSLVTLAARVCRAFANPWAEAEHEEHEREHERREREGERHEREDERHERGGERGARLSGAEFFGLGRWYAAEGRPIEAERAYRTVLRLCPGPTPSIVEGQALSTVEGQARGAGLPPDLRVEALRTLGYLLKRADRRAEAFAYWQQLAVETAPHTADHILAHVELAKYFEWHVGDLSLAAGWTRAALARVQNWPAGMHREVALAELRHRLARLERKISKAQTPGPKAQDGRLGTDAPDRGEQIDA